MFINIVIRVLGLNKDFDISIPKGMILKNAYELINKIMIDETFGEINIENGFSLVKISDGKLLNIDKTLEEQKIDNGEILLFV
ncbi:MAG: hypothetical protein J6O09_00695 [Lachnospiraceae bacterium]|nr:hypothetical protein [Lachnospiraceae bacterium]